MNINPQLPVNEDVLIHFSVAIVVLCNIVKNYHYSDGYELPLISFVSDLFLEALSVHKGNSPKWED